jgi:hypothetical protein
VVAKEKKAVVRDSASRWSLSRAVDEFQISDDAKVQIQQTTERRLRLERQSLELATPTDEIWGNVIARVDPSWRLSAEENRRQAEGWSQDRIQRWRTSVQTWTNIVGRFLHVIPFEETMQGFDREDWTQDHVEAVISARINKIRTSLQSKIEQLRIEARVQEFKHQIEAFRNANLVMFASVGDASADPKMIEMSVLEERRSMLKPPLDRITFTSSGSDLFNVYLVRRSDVKELAAPGKSEAERRTLVRSFLEKSGLFNNRKGLSKKQITNERVIPFLRSKGYKIPKDNSQLFENIYREVVRIFKESR